VTLESHKLTWNTTILISKFIVQVVFKLDTEAEATAITEKTYKSLPHIVLQKSQKILQRPAKQHFNVLCQFTTTLSHGQRSSIQTIYVINGLKTNLLGLTTLNILCRVDALTCDAQSRFPTLLKVWGWIYILCIPRQYLWERRSCKDSLRWRIIELFLE